MVAAGPVQDHRAASIAAHTLGPNAYRQLEASLIVGDAWVIDSDMANLDLHLSRADTVVFH